MAEIHAYEKVQSDPTTRLIRTRLDSVLSHPRAVNVRFSNGVATLLGVAFLDEARAILSALQLIPAVRKIENRVYLLERPKANSVNPVEKQGLQLDMFRTGEIPTSPAVRIGIGALGLLGAAYGIRRRDLGGAILAGIGVGALIRAVTNLSTLQLVSLTLQPVVRLHRVIEIDTSVENVFDFWKHFSNFSRFMSFVHKVEINDRGGFTWDMAGPGGIPIRFDAEITKLIPSQVIAWRSLHGAMIRNSGEVFFQELPGQKTRLDVCLNYAPPVGFLGYGVTRLLGFDPKLRFDDDLILMKGLIETEAAQPRVTGARAQALR